MFSLIISIIAIALVAALALASIYYGGSAFQEGSSDAEASTVVNQGQQIQGAVTLAKVNEFKFDQKLKDGITEATEIEEMIEAGYVKETPAVRGKKWVLTTASSIATVEVPTQDVCEKIEERFDGSTDDLATAAPTGAAIQAFGCYKDGAVYKGYYKM